MSDLLWSGGSENYQWMTGDWTSKVPQIEQGRSSGRNPTVRAAKFLRVGHDYKSDETSNRLDVMENETEQN